MDYFKKTGKKEMMFDFEKLEKIMDSLLKEMVQESVNESKQKPVVMGFTMRFDPQGKPVMEEFGDIAFREKEAWLLEAREPLVNVNNSWEDIVLTVELPGVNREEIDLRLEPNKITVSVEREEVPYYKEITLMQEIFTENSKASFKNGVLEIVLKKKAPLRGKKLKIH